MRIPPRLQESLFWEKKILRRSMEPYLPEPLVQRPKVPFFYGPGQQYSHRLAYSLLTANNQEFLNEAIFDNPAVEKVYDKNTISKLVAEIKTCPTYNGTGELMEYACWGLLSQWIGKGMPEPEGEFQDNLLWYDLKDWNRQSSELARELLESTPAVSSAGSSLAAAWNEESIVAFAKDTLPLLRIDNNDIYIVQNGVTKFLIESREEPEFAAFMKAVDSKKSIAQIARESGFSPDKVLSNIAESIDYGVLFINIGARFH